MADVEQLYQGQVADFRNVGGTALSQDECRKFVSTLRGKHLLITGGASGIGRDLARVAAQNGALVSIGDLNVDAARKVAGELRTLGGKAMAKRCSVLDWESQRDFFKAAEDELGPIDIVFPGAGVGERMSPGFEDDLFNKDGDLDKPITITLDVNLTGVVYSTKLAYHYLRKHPGRKGKALIFIGSILGWHPIPLGPMYSTSKAALLGLMRSAFFEMHAHNVRTSIICPWFVETGIIEPFYRFGLLGTPFAQMNSTMDAIIAAASHPEQDGSALIVDPTGVLTVPFDAITFGDSKVYSQLDERAVVVFSARAFTMDLLKVIRIYVGMYVNQNRRLVLLLALAAWLYRRRGYRVR